MSEKETERWLSTPQADKPVLHRAALLPEVESKTALQKKLHPKNSLAGASWIIAKLGGWDRYPK